MLSYAFAVGMAATVNPCGAVMLPAYLTWFTRSEVGRAPRPALRVPRAVLAGLGATVGFVAVFAAVGAVVDAGMSAFMNATPYVGIAVGFALIVVGVLTASGRHVSLRVPGSGRSFGGAGRGPRAMVGFGVSYALVSLGCALPLFLAGVAGAFTSGGVSEGVGAFVAYGLGMGAVLTALAVAVAITPHAKFRSLRAAGGRMQRPAGALLGLVGAYIVYYWVVGGLLASQAGSGPIDTVDSVAARVAAVLAAAGPLLGVGLVAVVATAVVLARLSDRRRSNGGGGEAPGGPATREVPPGPVPPRPARRRAFRRALPFLAAGLAAATVEAVLAGGMLGRDVTSSATAGVTPPGAAALSPAIDETLSFDWLSGSSVSPPQFTLTDQHGQTESLSSFRGKAVVLSFNDNHCTTLCPLYAQDVRAAVADLGPLASRVAFVAVNVNPFYPQVASDVAFDREQNLSNVAQWHYLTGPLPTLKAVWQAYGEQPIIGPDQTVNHQSALEFIGPSGKLRGVGSYGVGSADATRWGYALATVTEDLLGVHAQLTAHVASPAPPVPSTGAPGFSLPVLGAASTTKISLQDLRGHVVVLNFFASWCSSCQAEAAGLATADRNLPGSVRLVGIDVNDTHSSATAFVDRYRLAYPVGFDANGDVAAAYGVNGLPTTIFVSASGRVVARHIGDISPSALTQQAAQLFGHP
ncbi:MAG: redoxin domain-containing protein [Acidimicrobiales bacterium]